MDARIAAKCLSTALGAVLLVGLASCSPNPPEQGALASDATAPPIATADAARIGDLIADAKGRVLVVNLWATWCPPCVEEMPEFVEFVGRSDSAEVQFLSLNCDDPALADTRLVAFRDKHALNFPIHVLSETNELGELDLDAYSEALGIEFEGQLPVTILYDAQGKPRQEWKGTVTREALESAIQTIFSAQTTW